MEHSQGQRREAASGRRHGAFYVRQFGAALFVRLLVWICFGGLAILSLFLALGHRPGALWNAAVLTGILYLFERKWGRHAPLGQPLLTVDASGIGSTAFPHDRRQLRWHEIADVSIRDVRGGPVLVVVPKPISGRASRVCQVRLSMLRKPDRQLAQALISNHMLAAGIAWTQAMDAERAFAAQMNLLPGTWGV
jgi:rhomboid protease GluP